jgi:hypothetical protein
MDEVKLFDDNVNALSLFRDNHIGVVIQMYRYSKKISGYADDGREILSSNKHAIKTIQVAASGINSTKFKIDVQEAIAKMYQELQTIQVKDQMISGVLNDYKSQNKIKTPNK